MSFQLLLWWFEFFYPDTTKRDISKLYPIISFMSSCLLLAAWSLPLVACSSRQSVPGYPGPACERSNSSQHGSVYVVRPLIAWPQIRHLFSQRLELWRIRAQVWPSKWGFNDDHHLLKRLTHLTPDHSSKLWFNARGAPRVIRAQAGAINTRLNPKGLQDRLFNIWTTLNCHIL